MLLVFFLLSFISKTKQLSVYHESKTKERNQAMQPWPNYGIKTANSDMVLLNLLPHHKIYSWMLFPVSVFHAKLWNSTYHTGSWLLICLVSYSSWERTVFYASGWVYIKFIIYQWLTQLGFFFNWGAQTNTPLYIHMYI